eukprot:TRINITY_DN12454_c0_g1_i1.p1 TRINITY_DN12454_c0_g1~~TRINITY_DN12454_c0_g1_i1.p1  ORF type:complete len:2160 (+),score=467.22 TRINITY_DN12454_c0_g1_i1:252-6731(+)
MRFSIFGQIVACLVSSWLPASAWRDSTFEHVGSPRKRVLSASGFNGSHLAAVSEADSAAALLEEDTVQEAEPRELKMSRAPWRSPSVMRLKAEEEARRKRAEKDAADAQEGGEEGIKKRDEAQKQAQKEEQKQKEEENPAADSSGAALEAGDEEASPHSAEEQVVPVGEKNSAEGQAAAGQAGPTPAEEQAGPAEESPKAAEGKAAITDDESQVDKANKVASKLNHWIGEQMPTNTTRSCQHYGCSEKYVRTQECQCHSQCAKFLSCCGDFSTVCRKVGCVDYGCSSSYMPERQCQCEPTCLKFGNCCHDFTQVCPIQDHPAQSHLKLQPCFKYSWQACGMTTHCAYVSESRNEQWTSILWIRNILGKCVGVTSLKHQAGSFQYLEKRPSGPSLFVRTKFVDQKLDVAYLPIQGELDMSWGAVRAWSCQFVRSLDDGVQNTANIDDCKDICMETPGCLAVQFELTEHQCTLLDHSTCLRGVVKNNAVGGSEYTDCSCKEDMTGNLQIVNRRQLPTEVGCYSHQQGEDGSENRFKGGLKFGPQEHGYNLKTCMTACEGFTYMGLFNRGFCSCDNAVDKTSARDELPIEECGARCTGDPLGSCGSERSLMVYKVGTETCQDAHFKEDDGRVWSLRDPHLQPISCLWMVTIWENATLGIKAGDGCRSQELFGVKGALRYMTVSELCCASCKGRTGKNFVVGTPLALRIAPDTAIRDGSELLTLRDITVHESMEKEWTRLGTLDAGTEVVARGKVEHWKGVSYVPVEPQGYVDFRALRLLSAIGKKGRKARKPPEAPTEAPEPDRDTIEEEAEESFRVGGAFPGCRVKTEAKSVTTSVISNPDFNALEALAMYLSDSPTCRRLSGNSAENVPSVGSWRAEKTAVRFVNSDIFNLQNAGRAVRKRNALKEWLTEKGHSIQLNALNVKVVPKDIDNPSSEWEAIIRIQDHERLFGEQLFLCEDFGEEPHCVAKLELKRFTYFPHQLVPGFGFMPALDDPQRTSPAIVGFVEIVMIITALGAVAGVVGLLYCLIRAVVAYLRFLFGSHESMTAEEQRHLKQLGVEIKVKKQAVPVPNLERPGASSSPVLGAARSPAASMDGPGLLRSGASEDGMSSMESDEESSHGDEEVMILPSAYAPTLLDLGIQLVYSMIMCVAGLKIYETLSPEVAHEIGNFMFIFVLAPLGLHLLLVFIYMEVFLHWEDSKIHLEEGILVKLPAAGLEQSPAGITALLVGVTNAFLLGCVAGNATGFGYVCALAYPFLSAELWRLGRAYAAEPSIRMNGDMELASLEVAKALAKLEHSELQEQTVARTLKALMTRNGLPGALLSVALIGAAIFIACATVLNVQMMEGALHDCQLSTGTWLSSDPFHKEENVHTIMVDDSTKSISLTCKPGEYNYVNEPAVVEYPSGKVKHEIITKVVEASTTEYVVTVELEKSSLMPTKITLPIEARNGRALYEFYVIRVAHHMVAYAGGEIDDWRNSGEKTASFKEARQFSDLKKHPDWYLPQLDRKSVWMGLTVNEFIIAPVKPTMKEDLKVCGTKRDCYNKKGLYDPASERVPRFVWDNCSTVCPDIGTYGPSCALMRPERDGKGCLFMQGRQPYSLDDTYVEAASVLYKSIIDARSADAGVGIQKIMAGHDDQEVVERLKAPAWLLGTNTRFVVCDGTQCGRKAQEGNANQVVRRGWIQRRFSTSFTDGLKKSFKDSSRLRWEGRLRIEMERDGVSDGVQEVTINLAFRVPAIKTKLVNDCFLVPNQQADSDTFKPQVNLVPQFQIDTASYDLPAFQDCFMYGLDARYEKDWEMVVEKANRSSLHNKMVPSNMRFTAFFLRLQRRTDSHCEGYCESYKHLLSDGWDYSFKQSYFAVLYAIYYGRVNWFKAAVIQQAPLLSYGTTLGYSPLQLAAMSKNARMVKEVLRYDRDFYAPSAVQGKSAAMLVAESGDWRMMMWLLKAGCDINYRWPDAVGGGTMMLGAIRAGQTRMVNYLLRKNSTLSYEPWVARDGQYERYTYLQKAAEFGHTDIIRALIRHGSPVDELVGPTNRRITVLATACRQEVPKKAVISTLLKYKASPDGARGQDRSPLQLAACIGSVEAVQRLLLSGARASLVVRGKSARNSAQYASQDIKDMLENATYYEEHARLERAGAPADSDDFESGEDFQESPVAYGPC